MSAGHAVDEMDHTKMGAADDELVTLLCHRYYQSLYYTQLQESVLVVLNPYRTAVDVNSTEVLHEYRREFRNTRITQSSSPLPPHVFRLANNAYFYMQRTGQDQCVFFLGETGSGKSETRRLAAHALAGLGAALPGKRGARLALQLPAALYALECMGNVATDENENASSVSLYTELQFSQKGRLVGFKVLNYYLELTRAAVHWDTTSAFQIFSMLVTGASPEEARRWRMMQDTTFRLLEHAHDVSALHTPSTRKYARWLESLTLLGITAEQRASMLDVLAALLHLSNMDFSDEDGPLCPARVTTEEPLYIAAALLGIGASALANAVTHHTSVVNGQLCTAMLNRERAGRSRDRLMRMLYAQLFAWLNEHINMCFSHEQFDTYIGLLDVPGWRNRVQNHLDAMAINFASDMVYRHLTHVLCDRRTGEMDHEGLSHLAPLPSAIDTTNQVRLFTHVPGGLMHIMDDQTRRRPRKNSLTMVEAMQRRWVHHRALHVDKPDRLGPQAFTVTHFHGRVSYDPHGWLEQNDASYASEHLALLRGATASTSSRDNVFGSTNAFVRGLFRHLPETAHVHTPATLRPTRAPSTKRIARQRTLRAATSRHPDDDDVYGNALQDSAPTSAPTNEWPCVLGALATSLKTLLDVVDDAKAYFVLCVRPNANALANQCEPRMVQRQVHALGMAQFRSRHQHDYSVTLTFTEFCDRYGVLPAFDTLHLLGAPSAEAKMRVSDACAHMNWSDAYVAIGMHKVFLSHAVFRELEDELRARNPDEMQYQLRKAQADEQDAQNHVTDPYSPRALMPDESASAWPAPEHAAHGIAPRTSDDDLVAATNAAPYSAPLQGTPAFSYLGEYDADEAKGLLDGTLAAAEGEDLLLDDAKDTGPGEAVPPAGETVMERLPISAARRYWVVLTWLLTFWVPSFVLKRFQRLKRSDVRMAWREKLAINMLIWFICAVSIFVIVFLGNIMCPKQHLYSTNELSGHKGKDAFTAIRGEVFRLNGIIDAHLSSIPVVSRKVLMQYAGADATPIFPVQVNALCNGPNGPISPWVTMDSSNSTDPNAKYHDFRAFRTTDVRPDWYYEQMWYMRSLYRVGFIGYTPKELDNMLSDGRTIGIYDKYIYDLTPYIAQGNQGGYRMPEGVAPPSDLDRTILAPDVIELMAQNPGKDIKDQFDRLSLNAATLENQRVCLRNLFFIGMVDERNSPRCTFSKNLLLALSIVMVATVGFKFLAALQFTRSTPPEEHEKFVVCQVPCYTEGTDSIRKTVDSVARLRYDDRRKLIVVICDGNIMGAGNDAPTPQLVLDLLGADPHAHAEPRSFLSLGEGTKQHNMARVYSGLYEHAGHLVPYLVIAKCGTPDEVARPGNRGKRDSQLVLMRFFNKVHFGSPMSPLELEMYHHIKNIIGVNPSFYEYLLQVDADTELESSSLARLIAAFVRDKKVIGLCGETALSNEHQSITTMLQVYEYYISHYLVKAFESLFGSITCLPGCFSMFRFRAPDTQHPLFVANAVVDDYAENRVDTLHLKNLLYLGEDRYLTTLVLKHFPDYKTQFVQHAKSMTLAPDSWKVLLSQRRRWINSTVHNLFELLKTPQLCGFCLFSMRFIVLIDLLSTIIAPVTIGYLVYLLVVVIVDGSTIPMTSIILLAGIYGLQAIIFLLHRRFDMIGWMIVYILGLPLWSLILPLYSFWHMDDFSWGNTRVVTGEHGERLLVHQEGAFDPSEIPHMTWEQYENELWDQHHHSQFATGNDSRALPGALRQRTASFMSNDASSTMHAKAWSAPGHASLLQPDDVSLVEGKNPPNDTTGLGNMGAPDPHGWSDTVPMQPTYIHPVSQERGGVGADADPDADPLYAMDTRVPPPRLPPNEIIRLDIRRIIATNDLATITKRQVRAQLQDLYGCPIEEKKSYINAQIEATLRTM